MHTSTVIFFRTDTKLLIQSYDSCTAVVVLVTKIAKQSGLPV